MFGLESWKLITTCLFQFMLMFFLLSSSYFISFVISCVGVGLFDPVFKLEGVQEPGMKVVGPN